MNRNRLGGDASGFTVVELAITMAISMVVMLSLFGLLESQMRAERRVNSFADNTEELRQAIVAMQRDIRSSEPLKPLNTSAEYALRIELNIYDDILDTSPTPVTWVVDTANDELRREVKDSAGNATVTYRVRGVANDFGNPLFRFWKGNGEEYFATDTPADIAQCTIRIQIRLVAAPNAGPAPAIIASDAQLRNRLPGGIGCPQTILVTTTTAPTTTLLPPLPTTTTVQL